MHKCCLHCLKYLEEVQISVADPDCFETGPGPALHFGYLAFDIRTAISSGLLVIICSVVCILGMISANVI
jgi:hypothetical protein